MNTERSVTITREQSAFKQDEYSKILEKYSRPIDYEGIDDDDIYGILMRQISSYPLLQTSEERILGERLLINRDDAETTDVLYKANMRHIFSLSKSYANKTNGDLLDYYQSGCEGFLNSIACWNVNVSSFMTYSHFWIKRSMIQFIASNEHSMRLPSHANDDFGRLLKTGSKFFHTLGREPTIEELHQTTGVNKVSIENLMSVKNSVEIDLNSECDALTNTSREEKTVEESVIEKMQPMEISRLIKKSNLTELQINILEKHFGLRDCDPVSYKQIADELNVTRQHISFVAGKALEKLREQCFEDVAFEV